MRGSRCTLCSQVGFMSTSSIGVWGVSPVSSCFFVDDGFNPPFRSHHARFLAGIKVGGDKGDSLLLSICSVPWISSSARGKGGGPRRSTGVVLNEQSLPLAWRSHDGIPRCVQLAGCCRSLLEVGNAVERTRLHGNREPRRGATAARGKLEVADMSDLGPFTAWSARRRRGPLRFRARYRPGGSVP